MSVFHPSHPVYWKTEGNYDVGSHLIIENFNNPTLKWNTMNDPVMGGKSYSTVTFDDGIAVFDGEVVDVPFLREPGFITMKGEGFFPDVSSCDAIKVVAKSPEIYAGYRVSFGDRRVPDNGHARGYKADLLPPFGDEMGGVIIPFHDFTARWSDETGEAIVSCKQNPDFCPDLDTLRNFKSFSIWAEGVKGKIRLEIESITAIGCDDSISPKLVSNFEDVEISREANTDDTITDPNTHGGLVSVPFMSSMIAMALLVKFYFYKKQATEYHPVSKNENHEGIA